MDIMCLLICLFFAGFCLLCGYFEYRERKGYNMPFDEDKVFKGEHCRLRVVCNLTDEQLEKAVKDYGTIMDEAAVMQEWREVYVLGKWPQTKWIYKYPGD